MLLIILVSFIDIVATGSNAIEILTPVGMGDYVELAETKRYVGNKSYMIVIIYQRNIPQQWHKVHDKSASEALEYGKFRNMEQ